MKRKARIFKLKDAVERRSDHVKAMQVDVVLIYCDVFGYPACIQYFLLADIDAELGSRLLHRRCRRRLLGPHNKSPEGGEINEGF